MDRQLRASCRRPKRLRSAAPRRGLLRALAPFALFALGAAAPWGCGQGGPAEPADALVRIGGEVVVRVAEVQSRIDRMPPAARARYGSPEEQHKFLDRVVKSEILAAEAMRLGYAQDPEVIQATKAAMALKLVKERIGTEPAPGEITEADIERYYREHADEFIHPEEARVTEIVVGSRERALRVLSEARQDAGSLDMNGFRRLVFLYSEDEASAARGGDLTVVRGQEAAHPKALVDAAFALQRAGDLSPVIEAGGRFYILKLRQRVPASVQTFDQSRQRIARLVAEELRDRKVDDLVATVSKNLRVEVFEQRFADVRFEEEPPTGAAR